MTDHERLREIHHVTSTVRDAPAALSRIRALLDDVPSVEWRDAERASDAWIGDWRLAVWQLPGQTLWTMHVSTIKGPSVDEWRLPDRASAQRRAVALYVALRGVT